MAAKLQIATARRQIAFVAACMEKFGMKEREGATGKHALAPLTEFCSPRPRSLPPPSLARSLFRLSRFICAAVAVGSHGREGERGEGEIEAEKEMGFSPQC